MGSAAGSFVVVHRLRGRHVRQDHDLRLLHTDDADTDAEGALSETAAVAKARQWVALDYVRLAATLVAWLAAQMALSLS